MSNRKPRNNGLKAILVRHGIPEAEFLRKLNHGIEPGSPDFTPQTTLASYTRYGGKGENVPKLPRAKHICATLKKHWKISAKPLELFPDMTMTAEQMRRLTK